MAKYPFAEIEKKWQAIVDAGYQQDDFQFAVLFPVEDTDKNAGLPATP